MILSQLYGLHTETNTKTSHKLYPNVDTLQKIGNQRWIFKLIAYSILKTAICQQLHHGQTDVCIFTSSTSWCSNDKGVGQKLGEYPAEYPAFLDCVVSMFAHKK